MRQLDAGKRLNKVVCPIFPFLLLILCFLTPQNLTFSEDRKPLVFSESQHEKERRIVYKLRKREIQEAVQAPNSEKHSNTFGISVALTDLNNDGRNDILAFVRHDYLCGSWGCELIILIAKPNGRWQEAIDQVITDEPIFLSENKTKGFKDIILSKGTLKWNGTAYK